MTKKSKKEIVIHASKDQARIAIVENGELVEIYIENPENTRTIGDIHYARVRNLMPSIQAAFVDIGMKQDAFLHFSDVSETLPALLKSLGEGLKLADFTVTLRMRKRTSITLDNEEADTEEEPLPPKKNNRRGGRNRSRKGGKTAAGTDAAEAATNGKATEEKTDPKDLVHPARYLRNNQRVLVQIIKEPMASKGSRVTTNIALAGRFMVLIPFGNYVAVSRRIWSVRERRRLRTVAQSLVPENFGMIVRTVADGRDAKTLDRDLQVLLKKWEKIKAKLDAKPDPPLLLHQDVSMVSSVIRDLFTDDYERILIDDPRLFRSIKNYVQAVAPDMVPAIREYKAKQPIYEHVGIDNAMAEAFSDRVNLPSGGYIYIEHTEAMHVVDVNSGRSGHGQGKTQEENSLKVNQEAARVIAKQLRLRDLGGIIVVDFIDQRDDKNRRKVVDELKRAFRKDRAVTKVLPMSDFGLVQITRQRLRPSITRDASLSEEVLQAQAEKQETEAEAKTPKPQERPPLNPREADASPEAAPAPALSRKADVSTFVQEVEHWLAVYRKKTKKKSVKLRVHPFAAAILKRGMPSQLTKWYIKHRIRIELETDGALAPGGFVFKDAATRQNITQQYAQSA